MPTAAQPPLKRPRPAAEASTSLSPPSPLRARATTAIAATTASPSPLLPPFRVEYGASSPPASSALASFLNRHRGKITGVHIANKDATDRLLDRGRALVAALEAEEAAKATTTPQPPVEVCLHYSLKLQGGRGDEAVRRLSAFLQSAARLGAGGTDAAANAGKPNNPTNNPPRRYCSVLLVSGSGDPSRRPKGQLCTVEALEQLAAARAEAAATPSPPLPPLYVAFNPYFADPEDRKREQERLKRKLATGLVTGGVALQFGADAKLLEQGLAFLRREDAPSSKTILGSIFLPTKRFLAQMRFRPWRGVFLKENGFLESVESAERCCAATLGVYRKFGVTPLVETALEVEEANVGASKPGLGAAEALLRRGLEDE